MKRIVFISDLHCGSVYGITPPQFFSPYDEHREFQKEAWSTYDKTARKWINPDLLIVNGDCIDGAQTKQGGAELLTSDRLVQCDMATVAINRFHAKKVLMTFGSKYHVGDQAEDFEYKIAEDLGATIEGRLYFNVEGLTFDVRHKIGSSGIPHGRATSLLKEMMWDMVREAEESGPKVDVVVRSHVHYHIWVEDGKKVMFTTPALQLSRGRHGSRECTGKTHWGMIQLKVDDGVIVGKDVLLWSLAGNKPSVIKIA